MQDLQASLGYAVSSELHRETHNQPTNQPNKQPKHVSVSPALRWRLEGQFRASPCYTKSSTRDLILSLKKYVWTEQYINGRFALARPLTHQHARSSVFSVSRQGHRPHMQSLDDEVAKWLRTSNLYSYTMSLHGCTGRLMIGQNSSPHPQQCWG